MTKSELFCSIDPEQWESTVWIQDYRQGNQHSSHRQISIGLYIIHVIDKPILGSGQELQTPWKWNSFNKIKQTTTFWLVLFYLLAQFRSKEVQRNNMPIVYKEHISSVETEKETEKLKWMNRKSILCYAQRFEASNHIFVCHQEGFQNILSKLQSGIDPLKDSVDMMVKKYLIAFPIKIRNCIILSRTNSYKKSLAFLHIKKDTKNFVKELQKSLKIWTEKTLTLPNTVTADFYRGRGEVIFTKNKFSHFRDGQRVEKITRVNK